MQLKAFVRNVKDVKAVTPPKHENTSSWPLVTPKTGGPDSFELFLTESRPGGGGLEDVHPDSDHAYFILSGRGYAIVEGEKFDLNPGDLLFIPKNSKHEFRVVGDETLRFIVLFAPARK